MVRLLRGLAIALGSLLVLGETLRSWGQARPLPFIVDDYLIGGLLVAAACCTAHGLDRRGLRDLDLGTIATIALKPRGVSA